MTVKPKLLFWLNGFFMHFSLAYYLQSQIDADFFGITDINLKPKKFFENQKLVDFKKNWYFHDHIDLNQKKPDIEYLMNFEEKYKINLWKLVINERFFYKHNRFYKFQKDEILSFLEQELKLFETILDEVKPDYFLTYDPVLHHQKLFLDICKVRGIKILSIHFTGIKDKVIIAENATTLDLDKNSLENLIPNKLDTKNEPYDDIWHKYMADKTPNIKNKITALSQYLRTDDSELIKNNFMYIGRSKFNVIKDTLNLELNKKSRSNFLQKFSISSPDLTIPYVYFPMNIVEEMNLLHYAPFYTNQIEVIRHIAKSIPIDYVLYVKEHKGAGLRGWNEIDYYKEIMEIPNVKLIHPSYDNNLLLQHSKLLVTIRGTTAYKAVKYGIPSIIFGSQPFEIIPSVFRVNSLLELPNLIHKIIDKPVDVSYYKKYEQLIDNLGCSFDMFYYENLRNKTFFSGNILSNVEINEQDVHDFVENNKKLFSELVIEHLKFLNDTD
jgi:hypothetical protein